MHRAIRAIILALLLGVVACSPPSGLIAASSSQGIREPADGGIGTVKQAYALLLQQSVVQSTSDALLTGAIQELTLSVARAGVATPRFESPPFTGDAGKDWALFTPVYVQIVNRYSSKVPMARLAQAAIRGMTTKVGDCHTRLLDPAEYAEQVAEMQGSVKFGGVGASLRKAGPDEPIVIWRVIEGTPAKRAGLRVGDSILSVDGRDTSGMSVDTARELIRGREGSEVRLVIRRHGEPNPLELSVVRAQISPPSVEASLLPNGIGYVRIYAFTSEVPGQVSQALDGFDRKGARAWIFDLRNNGGGSLQAETRLLSELVPEGTLFTLWDRSGQRTAFSADGSSYRGRVPPVVVLVNEGTASGGEVFAAAVQDYRLGRVVGSRTAGCVGTGRIARLPDGSGLQVTVGKIYTGASNRMLNKLGLIPDVEVAMTVEDLVRGRDPQLDAALQLARGA